MQESQIVNLYIPRLLLNVKAEKIKSVFKELNIGKIFYIDMHYRINENNNKYFFAFISIRLYNTYASYEFYNNLIKYENVQIVYDESKNKYWEVKHHISRLERINTKNNDLYYSSIEEKKNLENDFDCLLKEIYDVVFIQKN